MTTTTRSTGRDEAAPGDAVVRVTRAVLETLAALGHGVLVCALVFGLADLATAGLETLLEVLSR